jgi:CheY-like chemotaxis protein
MTVMNGCATLNGQDAPSVPGSFERVEIWDVPECIDSGTAVPADSRPLRALLAEDNLIDQVNIRTLLERRGFTVTCVSNGREAVDQFAAGRYEIVLLDILMPEMDGFKAASRIREKELLYGQTPIIALTAYSLGAVLDTCRSVGMNGYLSKPVSGNDLEELFTRLDRNGFIGKEKGAGIKVVDPEVLPALDVNGSLENLGGDAGLYREIIAMFAHCAPEVIQELLVALQGDDPARVEFYSHNLKGMSANVGAKRLTELARTIHNSARFAGHGDLELWKARLQDEFETVTAAIAAADRSLSP